MARVINFFDGNESETTPTIGNIVASNLIQYANDAAYEAAELGAPVRGNLYFNTTDDVIRYYNGTAWISIVDESTAQTLTNKSIDADANTITNIDNADIKNSAGIDATKISSGIVNNTEFNHLDGLTDNIQDQLDDKQNQIDSNDADILDLQNDKQDISEKGQPNGYAGLDGSGHVPASQLPSFVDDVLEFADLASFPATGETGKIYVALDTNIIYRWSGTVYVEVGAAGGANQQLSNLIGPTEVNQDVIPDSNNTRALGTSVARWAQSFFTSIVSNSTIMGTLSRPSGPSGQGIISGIQSNTVATDNQSGIVDSGDVSLESGNTVNGDSGEVLLRTGIPSGSGARGSLVLQDGSEGVIGHVLTSKGVNGEAEWQPAAGGGGSKNYFTPGNSTFELATIGDWETDNGVGGPATGLTLSTTTTVGEVLEGVTSLKLVKNAANHNDEFIKLASQTIDPIDRGKQLFGSFAFKPISGYVSGDLILQVYDVTNSAVLYSGQEEDRELLNVTDPITVNYVAYLESTTAQIELRLKVNNTATNTFTMTFDEFKFGPAAVLPAVNISEWQIYTPTFTGLGAVTVPEFRWRRVGDTLEVFGSFVAGTPTATEARVSLPSSLFSSESKVPSLKAVGSLFSSGFFAGSWSVLIESEASYFTFGIQGSGTAGYTKAQGSTAFATGVSYSFYAKTPIKGWQASSTMTTNELGLQTVNVNAVGNGGAAITANVTNIDWTEVSDPFNAWNGTVFTAPKTGTYEFTGSIFFNSTIIAVLFVYKNDSVFQSCGLTDSTGQQTILINWKGKLNKGETISFRSNAGGTLSNNAFRHWLSISSQKDLTLIGAVRNDEYLEDSRALTTTGIPGANVWGDVAELTLSPGTWDLQGISTGVTAVTGGGRISTGIISTSGNVSPESIGGYRFDTQFNATSNFGISVVAHSGNVAITTPTTFYLKWNRFNTNVTSWGGKLWARRIK